MIDSAAIVALISGAIGTGIGAAAVRGYYTLLTAREKEKTLRGQHLSESFERLSERFDDLYGQHLKILREHTDLSGRYELQKQEIGMLKRRIEELQGYRSQQLKLARLTKALSAYHKNLKVEMLLKVLDNELIHDTNDEI